MAILGLSADVLQHRNHGAWSLPQPTSQDVCHGGHLCELIVACYYPHEITFDRHLRQACPAVYLGCQASHVRASNEYLSLISHLSGVVWPPALPPSDVPWRILFIIREEKNTKPPIFSRWISYTSGTDNVLTPRNVLF